MNLMLKCFTQTFAEEKLLLQSKTLENFKIFYYEAKRFENLEKKD